VIVMSARGQPPRRAARLRLAQVETPYVSSVVQIDRKPWSLAQTPCHTDVH
jgi:hypothetical protein